MYSSSGSSAASAKAKKSTTSSGKAGLAELSLSVDSALGKNRPNSAPMQQGLNNTVPNSVGANQSSSSGLTTSGMSNSADSMSLVEQRLRIVKRNRSKSGDDLLAPGNSVSGLPTVTPRLAVYPAQDTIVLTKHDQQLLDGLTREVMDVLFFPEAITA